MGSPVKCEQCNDILFTKDEQFQHREEIINAGRIAGKFRGNHHIRFLCRSCAQDLYNSWHGIPDQDQSTLLPWDGVE